MNALVITPEGTVRIKSVESDHLLSFLQSEVGGLIEEVPTGRESITAYVNDEGKVTDLPRNAVATAFCEGHLRLGDYIAGAMVIIGGPDATGDSTSVPDGVYEEAADLAVGFVVG